MSKIENHDIVVFSGDMAGKTSVMDHAAAGKRVAAVGKGVIGGSCIDIVARIPTKILARSAVAECISAAPFPRSREARGGRVQP
jgi:pyruvate/2-oxoglutarate dehydrogenase complex dihydrolipoamide dehydrogenase (E3) component